MAFNCDRPRSDDVVLGNQTPNPITAAVLGGLTGVKHRLASPLVETRIAALHEALKYGDAGLDLVILALKDPFWQVRKVADRLLQNQPEPKAKQALQEKFTNRYDTFVAMAKNGSVSDVDFLMEALEVDENTATYKLVDFVLGLVNTARGKDRIKYYLFNGTQMQRNYAALFFKRIKNRDVLTEAVKLGCIDRVQAFSK